MTPGENALAAGKTAHHHQGRDIMHTETAEPGTSIDVGAAALGYIQSPAHFDFTLRQAALLSIVCDRPGPHRVRDVARELGVAKPVITRAVDTFVRIGLAYRHPEDDRRSIDIVPTIAGRDARAAFRVGSH